MAKRRAERDLVKEDVDKSDEEEDAGEFTKADDDAIAKRIVRKARRRVTQSPSGPSPFAAFQGFGASVVNSPSFSDKVKPDIATAIKESNRDQISVEGSTTSEKKVDMESLKALNISCCKWIQQHLDKNPYVVLLPVFKDYEKHLATLNLTPGASRSTVPVASAKPPLFGPSPSFKIGSPPAATSLKLFPHGTGKVKADDNVKSETMKPVSAVSSTTFPGFQFTSTSSSPFNNGITAKDDTKTTASFNFTKKAVDVVAPVDVGSSKSEETLKVDSKPASAVSSTTFPVFHFSSNNSSAFNNGAKPWGEQKDAVAAPLFNLTNSKTNYGPGFFSSNFPSKPFEASSNDKAEKQEGEDPDEPPQSNFVPVGEEGSVFDIRCKVFVKKSGNFSSIGVGTLYLKVVGAKAQLIVRADTAQGSVLLNLLLSSELPLQSSGKNNILIVCIPTPDANPPPVPVLIRVKNGEERDKLLMEMKRLRER